MHVFWHWLLVHTGTVNEPGPYYGFWSGFGSDIGELLILGGLIQFFRHRNCHVRGCWRLQWHDHPDNGHPVCRRHHPHSGNVHADGSVDGT